MSPEQCAYAQVKTRRRRHPIRNTRRQDTWNQRIWMPCYARLVTLCKSLSSRTPDHETRPVCSFVTHCSLP